MRFMTPLPKMEIPPVSPGVAAMAGLSGYPWSRAPSRNRSRSVPTVQGPCRQPYAGWTKKNGLEVPVMETVHPRGRLKTELGKRSICPPSRYPHCEVLFMAMAQGGMNPAANPAGWSNGNAHGSSIHASPVLSN